MNFLRRHKLAAGGLAIAVVMLTVVTLDSANAAPILPGGGVGSTGAWHAAPVPQLVIPAANSIGYLEAQYAISQTEAKRRLLLQESAPDIDAALTQNFASSYGGMWLDQAGGGVLRVNSTSTTAITAALQTMPDASHIKVQAVKYSLASLNATRATLDAQVNATGQVADVVTDPVHDQVVVFQRAGASTAGAKARTSAAVTSAQNTVSSPNARVNSLVAGFHGEAVVRQETVGATKAGLTMAAAATTGCPTACPPPLRGGMRLDVNRTVAANDSDDLNQLWGECTNGFNVTDASGAHYLMTAGHCMVGSDKNGINKAYDNARHQISTEVADYENGSATYPADYSIQPISNTAYWQGTSPKNQVTDYCWAGMANLPSCKTVYIALSGFVPYTNVVMGTVLCATGTGDNDPNNGYKSSGAIPGTRCGEVTGLNGGIVTNICSRKGDSGGPLFSEVSGMAYGILNSGTVGNGACPTTKPGTEWSQYSPLDKIFSAVNAQVVAKEGKNLGFVLQTTP